MSDVDNALRRWLASAPATTYPSGIGDCERAAFRAGWAAHERHTDARGAQVGLLATPAGPAWTPVSGDGEARDTSRDAATSIAMPGSVRSTEGSVRVGSSSCACAAAATISDRHKAMGRQYRIKSMISQ